MIYIITDTHFNHSAMIPYCGRPENFDELIWKGLDQLKDDDILIHLGDICIGGGGRSYNRPGESLNLPLNLIIFNKYEKDITQRN